MEQRLESSVVCTGQLNTRQNRRSRDYEFVSLGVHAARTDPVFPDPIACPDCHADFIFSYYVDFR